MNNLESLKTLMKKSSPWLGLILIFLCFTTFAQEMYIPMSAVPRDIKDNHLHIFTCGTGVPQVTMQEVRKPACLAIYANKELILFDAGDGAIQTLSGMGLPFLSLQHIFLTHLHSDHIAGLGELLNAPWHSGRKLPVYIYGPYGTADVVEGFIKAYRLDVLFRGIGGAGLLNPSLAFATVQTLQKTNQPQKVFEKNGLTITAFPVNHLPVFPAYGYQVNYKNCKIVFSGDTSIYNGLEKTYANADVLINEAVSVPLYGKAVEVEAKGDPQLIAHAQQIFTYHSNSLDLAKLADKSHVKHLVLTHLLPAIGTTDQFKKDFVGGMSQYYKGPITVANDRDEFIIQDDCSVVHIPAKQPNIPITIMGTTRSSAQTNIAAATSQESVVPQQNVISNSVTFSQKDGRLKGLSVHYNVVGQGDETILFIHGLPLNASSWKSQVDFFSKRYKVVTLDLFGYGASSPLPSINVKDLSGLYASSIKATLDYLGIQKVVYVGFATGAHVGLRFAHDYPATVNKLVLINTSPKFMQGDNWPFGFDQARAGEFVKVINQKSLEDSLKFLVDVATQENCPNIAQIRTDILKMSLGVSKATLLSFFENLAKEDFRNFLPTLKMPTLIIASMIDKEVPVGVGIYMRAQIPHSSLVEINNMDHFVFITASGLVNSLIDNFILKQFRCS